MNEAGESLSLHALVLAAGASRRFGSPKQLVRAGGRPLMHAAIGRAVELCGSAVTVVLGAHAAELAPLLRHTPASIVTNRDWPEGIGSSIRAGMSHVPGASDGVLIVLADQPAVTTEDLRRLAAAWRRQPEYVVAALYAGTIGVPAIFPRTSFGALAQLRGDQGARAVMLRDPDRIVRVPVPGAELDIDTPEDLLSFETSSGRTPPES